MILQVIPFVYDFILNKSIPSFSDVSSYFTYENHKVSQRRVKWNPTWTLSLPSRQEYIWFSEGRTHGYQRVERSEFEKGFRRSRTSSTGLPFGSSRPLLLGPLLSVITLDSRSGGTGSLLVKTLRYMYQELFDFGDNRCCRSSSLCVWNNLKTERTEWEGLESGRFYDGHGFRNRVRDENLSLPR